MNVILVLMDSLNRHFLPAYGNNWVKTPNIDRLAARSAVFDSHYIGSMPCMPARHDIWTGNLEFLWRPWGPIEPGEVTLPQMLKGKVVSQLVTDHYHFFELGGETYHVDFNGWEFIRGHENDPWVTRPNKIDVKKGRCTPQYMRNMQRLKEEKDYLSPRTFQAAADWLDENHGQHERFFLFIDEFDPHEPFHSSEPYNAMYDANWTEGPFFWPTYGPNRYSESEINHLRAQYAGKLTMADAWLGKLLDRMDAHGMWDDTMVILTTDHGHFLGEHEWVGKGIFPQYQAIAHIPLMICAPGIPPRRIDALTTTVDICPTVLEAFNIVPGRMNGRSVLSLLQGKAQSIRDYALYGWFGAFVQITDGSHTYFRSPTTEDNGPLYVYRSTWNTAPWWKLPVPDERLEIGGFLPGDTRVIGRILLDEEEKKRLSVHPSNVKQPTQLYDIRNDPGQQNDLSKDAILSRKYETLLSGALKEVGCPPEQFFRLGLDSKRRRSTRAQTRSPL